MARRKTSVRVSVIVWKEDNVSLLFLTGSKEENGDEVVSEADFIEANFDGIEESSVCESEYNIDQRNVAIYVQTNRGKPSLLLNGHKYRKVYKTKNGTRWNCSKSKNCSAFLYVNDIDEVIMSSEEHNHPESEKLVQEMHTIGKFNYLS